MIETIKKLFFDQKRAQDEHKIVVDIIYRANSYTCDKPYAIYPYSQMSKNYEELEKLPGIISHLQDENEELKAEIEHYKTHVATVSQVIDTILDTVEKRYELKKTVNK